MTRTANNAAGYTELGVGPRKSALAKLGWYAANPRVTMVLCYCVGGIALSLLSTSTCAAVYHALPLLAFREHRHGGPTLDTGWDNYC
jgi:hypothetical protein